jgi:nitroreductase
MDVQDAIAARFSCRAFLPTPVDETVVRDILERAARAPSGGNLQPWRVAALAGAPLEALKAAIRARPELQPKGEGAEYDVYPKELSEPYRARSFEVGALLYAAIGVERADRPGRLRQYANNFELFGAPVGLFVSIDRGMGPPQWADVGGFIQTVMLLAKTHGLDSCAQEAWTLWHETVYAHVPIPESHMLFCAIALGTADAAAPINRWRSPRASLDEFASFHGFGEAG